MARWNVSICDKSGWRNFSVDLPQGPFDDREAKILRARGDLISQMRDWSGGNDPRFDGHAMIIEPA